MACIDMNTWYSRVDKPDRPGLGALRPRSIARRGLRRGRRGRAPREVGARRARPRGLPEDERRGRDARARADRAPIDVLRCTGVRGDRRAHARVDPPRARHDRVGEGEAARRAHRREPERRGQDDRVGLLGATSAGRIRVDAASLGRGEGGARPADVHDGRCPRRVAKDGDLFSGVLEGGQSLARRSSRCPRARRASAGGRACPARRCRDGRRAPRSSR